jgi:hypothetical protein
MPKFIKLFLLIFIASGCAAMSMYPSAQQMAQTSRDFNKPFEEVWNCAMEALVGNGDNLSFVNKNNGLITIKNEDKNIVESELWLLVSFPPSEVEWRTMRTEGNILIRPIDNNSTRVSCDFNIKARGLPYETRRNLGTRPSYNDNLSGTMDRVPLVSFPQEYDLQSNGTLEQNYLNLIVGRCSN